MENNKQQMGITPLSLPKGGGAIVGMGETLGAIGPSGMATFTLPLPISTGRGYAPALALDYNSGNGNGPFGLGWQMNTLSIRRRTVNGVPNYDYHDEFIGPNGEVLIADAESDGASPDSRYASADFTVTRYQPRIEGGFDRIEFWQPQDATSNLTAFWLIYGADGQQHCLGKSAQACIANPEHPTHIAEWLLEESVSSTGEHICYDYQSENDTGIEPSERDNHPQASAQRYLQQVRYGNLLSSETLYAFKKLLPEEENWLFTLIFDYGERPTSLFDVPTLYATNHWTCRQDPFSRYEYGFEVRTRRLCQQVLMFHNLQQLTGDRTESDAALVGRLHLDYLISPYATQLVRCQQVAHEKDGTAQTQPPLEFDYQEFQFLSEKNWHDIPEWDKFNQYYQLVDLNGEGLPGMLYQDSGSWLYHPPIRQPASSNNDNKKNHNDDITYGSAKILPKIPSLRDVASLMDINGDGRLDWVISQPGMAGYYSRNPDESWTQFTPLSALPAEYFHPQAQLADLIGNGISDLALIGPKSVRLYANKRDGFAAGQQVYQNESVTLPIPGASQHELVAFSDPLGSGQQHLLRVRHNSVTCWPNIGHGRFGKPVTLTGFSQPADSFNPQNIWLADIDGSGTTDLIYAHRDHLLIYRNQSGNGFTPPQKLPLPQGIRYDNTCQLTLADIQGLGVTSLLLSVPHMSSRHWRYDFSTVKPYLLSTINNNMGAENRLSYRSSAQLWLDEKSAAAAEGRTIACGLPFPIHLLVETEQIDEITGNNLRQSAHYYHGFYDGIEREFRGFGRVDITDTHADAKGSSRERTPPSFSRSWFHTGRPDDESRYAPEFWQHGMDLYQRNISASSIRLSHFNPDTSQDDELTEVSPLQAYWLIRSLKGALLRNELFGLDNSEFSSVPYHVSHTRHQVRQVRPPNPSQLSPIAMPMLLEEMDYHYERIAQDPQCSQQVIIRSDQYGHPLHSVTINYPRRSEENVAPYSWLATRHEKTASEPPQVSHWQSCYDDQQRLLRLTDSQQSYRHVIEDGALLLGLPWQQRTDFSTYSENVLPLEGLSYEFLTERRSTLGTLLEQVYGGQQETFYHPDHTRQGLVIASESAEFDDIALHALDQMIPPGQGRDEQLKKAGYQLTPRLFALDGETKVWTARRGLTEYFTASKFYRPEKQRSSALVGFTHFGWDRTTCAITTITLADGSETKAQYDYRFITPYHLTDLNDNEHYVALDAFGRVTSSRFWGTETIEKETKNDQGETVIEEVVITNGFTPPEKHKPFIVPQTVEAAIAIENEVIPVAQFIVYQPFSWMTLVAGEVWANKNAFDWQTLLEKGVVQKEGYVCTLGLRRWARQHQDTVADVIKKAREQTPPQPPHALSVITDRYDRDKKQPGYKQQHQQAISFSDGFGRIVQSVQRVEPGEAYLRDPNGRLIDDGDRGLKINTAKQRWAVSGRTEFDNKGLPIRSYQPYFINDWRYISDDSARKDAYADTHVYDPLGREISVITAKGYLRRVQYFPWFAISEDENDTAAEVIKNNSIQ